MKTYTQPRKVSSRGERTSDRRTTILALNIVLFGAVVYIICSYCFA